MNALIHAQTAAERILKLYESGRLEDDETEFFRDLIAMANVNSLAVQMAAYARNFPDKVPERIRTIAMELSGIKEAEVMAS